MVNEKDEDPAIMEIFFYLERKTISTHTHTHTHTHTLMLGSEKGEKGGKEKRIDCGEGEKSDGNIL